MALFFNNIALCFDSDCPVHGRLSPIITHQSACYCAKLIKTTIMQNMACFGYRRSCVKQHSCGHTRMVYVIIYDDRLGGYGTKNH